MGSKEFACFNRLYEDALRRQEKQKKLNIQRLGHDGLPAPRRASLAGSNSAADLAALQQQQRQEQQQQYQEQLLMLQQQQRQQQLELQQKFQDVAGDFGGAAALDNVGSSTAFWPPGPPGQVGHSMPQPPRMGHTMSLPSLVRQTTFSDDTDGWNAGHGLSDKSKFGATWSAHSRQGAGAKLPFLHLSGESVAPGGGRLPPPLAGDTPHGSPSMDPIGESVRHGLGISSMAATTVGPLKTGWRGRSAARSVFVPSRGPRESMVSTSHGAIASGLGGSKGTDSDGDRYIDTGPSFTLVGQSAMVK